MLIIHTVIKTMIIVSVAYVICFFPGNVLFIIITVQTSTSTSLFVGYYASVVLNYIYICMNPFIYAIKHEGVKEELARLLQACRKCTHGNVVEDATRNTSNNSGNVTANRAQQPPTGTTRHC